jgi:hybrid cluster-associated redox disulfide protein
MPGKTSALVTGDMTFAEVISRYPKSVPVMLKYGLHCIGCHIATTESVERGAEAHGFSKAKTKELIRDLNKAAKR